MRTPKFFIALMGIAELLFASPPAKASATIAGKRITAGVHVPAGTYSLYVLVKDPDNWKLIVNRQAGQGGHIYNARMDLCRVDLKMDRPNTPVEKLRYTITTTENTGTIQLEWENHVASVPIRAT